MNIRLVSQLFLLSHCCLQLCAHAQGTAFTYAGRLNDGGSAANGTYDLTFTLFGVSSGGSAVGGPLTSSAVPVSSGWFTTTLDFGANFPGANRWLEIAVRTNGGGAFTTLTPRQPLLPTPYAMYAENAGTVTNGAISSGQLQTPGAPGDGQVLVYSGGSLVWSNAAAASGSWSLTGNAGALQGVNFLGTTDTNPLELRTGNTRALRLEPDPYGYGEVNVIAGAANNSVGFASAAGFIGGGYANTIGSFVTRALIGGGDDNTNQAGGGTIAGGSYNTIGLGADNATIGGGEHNTVARLPINVIGVGANDSTISGGASNTVGNAAFYATIPGGANNSATGSGSFAAGVNAHALHSGSFVWGDGTRYAASGAPNQFQIQATGGMNIYTDNNRVGLAGSAGLDFGVTTRQMLNLYGLNGGGGYGIGVQNFTLYARTGDSFAWYQGGSHNDAQTNSGGGKTLMTLDSSGLLTVNAVTILGGADLAEPFHMSAGEIPKGAVVVIDEEHPGQLKLSERAYDTRVAGVVSGARQIHPGLRLQQQGALEGGQDVALTGRVYVQADAGFGAIQPGDLLTTADTPGHAMKVRDHARAQGAILGKAMSTLKEGRGMVLVLVTLQ